MNHLTIEQLKEIFQELVPEKQYDLSNKKSIAPDSRFCHDVSKLIAATQPRKIIETGTFLGRGTTTVLYNALKAHGQPFKLITIECNPEYETKAQQYFEENNMHEILPLLGHSLPKHLIPSQETIQTNLVDNAPKNPLIHQDFPEHKRAIAYFTEINHVVPDNQLTIAIEMFENSPDLILLDSAGHIGFEEFLLVLQVNIETPYYLILDDTYHVKHYKTLEFIKQDPRFTLLVDSKEKFGFCIAKYL